MATQRSSVSETKRGAIGTPFCLPWHLALPVWQEQERSQKRVFSALLQAGASAVACALRPTGLCTSHTVKQGEGLLSRNGGFW